jgi:hypothetical protein
VTAWGITQKSVVGGPRIISPHFFNGLRAHPQKGLVVLAMLRLDVETCLVVVAETIPDSEEPLQYGLILESNRISLDILKLFQDEGYMYFPDTGKQWTPKWIQIQWGWLDEAHTNSLL